MSAPNLILVMEIATPLERECTACPSTIPAGDSYFRFDRESKSHRVCLRCWRALKEKE